MPSSSPRPPIKRGRILLYAGFVQAASIVVFLYGLEAWLRWRYREQPVPTAERAVIYYPLGPDIAGQTLRFDQVEYTTTMSYNRMGFRDAELPGRKSAVEKRIVYVGDSFVEGIGVSEADRFSNITQRALGDSGGTFSSINLGQAGTDPINYLNNLVNIGIPLRPDLVIFGLYLGNDFEGAARHAVTSKWIPPQKTSGFASEASPTSYPLMLGYVRAMLGQYLQQERRLVRRSQAQEFWPRLYRRPIDAEMLRERAELSREEMQRALARIDPELVTASFAGRLNPSRLVEAVRKEHNTHRMRYGDSDFDAVASVIVECQRICSEYGATLLVLIIPDIMQVEPESFLSAYKRWGFTEMPLRVLQLPELRQRTVAFLTQQQIAFIDTTDSLAAMEERAYYPLDLHLTRSGHRRVAEELLRHPAFTALK